MPQNLTVATWNIQTLNAHLPWPGRREQIWQTIASLDADFIGLQEAMPQQVNQTAAWVQQQGLPYGVIGLGRKCDPTKPDGLARIDPASPEAVHGDEFSPLLYRKDRFSYEPLPRQGYDAAAAAQPENAQTIWLHSDAALRHTPGTMMPGTRFPRIFTWGRFRCAATDAVLYVYNTHVDHESHAARMAAAEQITQHMQALESSLPPIVLMGDLNAPPASAEVRAYEPLLTRCCCNEWTWHELAQVKPPVQLDHIFASSHFAVRESRVLRPRGPHGERFSDHDPVVTSFRF